MAFTLITDLKTPTVFTGYAMERTKELTAFIASGILGEDGILKNWMTSEIGSGGGNVTLNRPTWRDLDASGETPGTAGAERVSDDTQSAVYLGNAGPVPQGITTHTEIAVRVNRNNHWAVGSLASNVVGVKNPDTLGVIGTLVGTYWARRLQHLVLAVTAGVVASNILNNAGDMLFDISGGAFINGVTNFSADALYDALQTLGDADNQITNLAIHSVVRNRMRKNNLIDTVRDTDGNYMFDAFQGLRLTVDDSLPKTGQVYDSYLFGPGFLRYAMVPPENATTLEFRNEGGNGAGSEELWNRVAWCVHPMGHQMVDATPLTLTNTRFAAAATWTRVTQTRKNLPFAVLRTREA